MDASRELLDDDQRLVIVGGLHRSGTSLVARAIAALPGATGFTGTGTPENEGQFLQDVFPVTAALRPGYFAFNPAARMTEESPLATADNAARLIECWSHHWDTSARVLVEKSPPNLLRTRFFASLFPNALQVHVIRNPLVVAMATQKWSETGLASLVDHTMAAYGILLHDLSATRADAVLVRYEAFVADPGAVLGEVARRLDIEPDQIPLPPVRADIDESYEAILEVDEPVEVLRHLIGRNRERVRKWGFDVAATRRVVEYVLQRWRTEFAALGYPGARPDPDAPATYDRADAAGLAAAFHPPR